MTQPLDAASGSKAAVAEAMAPSVPEHELIRIIGSGSSGQVWLARNALGTYRAVKIVQRQAFRQVQSFEREFNGLLKFEPVSRLHDGLVDILPFKGAIVTGYSREDLLEIYQLRELLEGACARQAFAVVSLPRDAKRF